MQRDLLQCFKHMEVVEVDGDVVVEALIADTHQRQQRDGATGWSNRAHSSLLVNAQEGLQ